MTCPHTNITHCPLYIAAHDVPALGCDDGQMDSGSCAITRGLDYATALGKLTAADPHMVADCKWSEDKAAARAQRLRNINALGLN